jgi:hypothetical protein
MLPVNELSASKKDHDEMDSACNRRTTLFQ